MIELFAEDRRLENPAPGQPYSAVLRIEPLEENAKKIILGILAVLVSYSVVLPAIAWIVLGIGWLARGRVGSFADFRSQALDYHLVEGMIASHLALASMIIITMVVVRQLHFFHPKWLCSVQPGMRWRYLIVAAMAATVVLNAGYWLSRAGQPFVVGTDASTPLWLVAIIVFVPLQAAGEEFLFRGYLIQAIGAFSRFRALTVLVSAVIFALMHGTQDLPLFVDRFAFGLLAGALVIMTGGLEAAIAIHAVNNVFAFGYAAVGGGVAQVHAMQSSSWVTTGWNITAYLLAAVVAWGIARWFNAAKVTPDLSNRSRVR